MNVKKGKRATIWEMLFVYLAISLVLGQPLRWNWGENFIYGGVLFLAISVVIEIKFYLKKKEKTEYTPVLNTEEKLSMLKTLLDNNVITQDEYESKKKMLAA